MKELEKKLDKIIETSNSLKYNQFTKLARQAFDKAKVSLANKQLYLTSVTAWNNHFICFHDRISDSTKMYSSEGDFAYLPYDENLKELAYILNRAEKELMLLPTIE